MKYMLKNILLILFATVFIIIIFKMCDINKILSLPDQRLIIRKLLCYSLLSFTTGFIFYSINSKVNLFKAIIIWSLVLVVIISLVLSFITNQLILLDSLSLFVIPFTILAGIVYSLIENKRG